MQHSDGGRSIADGGDEELNAFALAVSRAIGFGSASHLSQPRNGLPSSDCRLRLGRSFARMLCYGSLFDRRSRVSQRPASSASPRSDRRIATFS
jgi:hypothetical protein